jgi:signal transduction histidine kinase
MPIDGNPGGAVSFGLYERLTHAVGKHWVPVGIWALIASIFAFDIVTGPENIALCFAYLLPIFLSSLEARPRPYLYAVAATGLLALVGAVSMLFDDIPRAAVLANRSIAIATVWLGAVLVGVLNRRRAELQHDVERQQRFVDILSHEIRNALTAVGGHAQRLAKLSEKLTPSDVAARADKIRGAAARIEAIISRVQFASSLGNGMVPMLRDDVDLNALVRQLIDRLKEEHEERLIELDLSPETLRIHGDEVLLRHAIENVVLNSLQYSPKGSRVLVHTTATGSGMRITIADFGPGIAPDDLTRIREPYFRGANGESRSGTGLGLYFADRIVQGHKGSVQIDSALGKGTTVTIEVPASDKAVRA